MVAALAALGTGHAAKLGGPQNDRVFQETPLLEVFDEGGDGFGHSHGERAVVLGDVLVRVPIAAREAVVVAGPDLDEPYAPLDEASGGEALPAHDVGLFRGVDLGGPLLRGVVDAVSLLDPGGFLRQVQRFGRRQLHAGGEFVGADAGLQALVSRTCCCVDSVQPFQGGQPIGLGLRCDIAAVGGREEGFNGVLRPDANQCSLVFCGQECRVPVLCAV